MFVTYLQKLKERSWLVISVFSGLLFLFILVDHILPFSRELIKIKKNIRENREKVDKVKNWNIMYNRIEKRKKHLKKQIEELVFSQKQDTHLSAILKFLSESAKENGIHIQTIKPQAIKKTKRHIELPIQLTMTTKFHQLGRFVNNIETSEPIIKIERMRIAANKMISSILNVEITLLVYYLERSFAN